MRDSRQEWKASQKKVPLLVFLQSYNNNMPKNLPQASAALLEKFKEEHLTLFKSDDLWSLDLHRKKLIDWLPRNSGAL